MSLPLSSPPLFLPLPFPISRRHCWGGHAPPASLLKRVGRSVSSDPLGRPHHRPGHGLGRRTFLCVWGWHAPPPAVSWRWGPLAGHRRVEEAGEGASQHARRRAREPLWQRGNKRIKVSASLIPKPGVANPSLLFFGGGRGSEQGSGGFARGPAELGVPHPAFSVMHWLSDFERVTCPQFFFYNMGTIAPTSLSHCESQTSA